MRSIFVFHWNGWRQLALDFIKIQAGFFMFGLSINLMVRADLGASPWVALEKGLTGWLPLTLGQATITVAFIIVTLDLLLRQPLGWGTLANMLSIGLWVDALGPWVPPAPPGLWLQGLMLLAATGLMGFGTGVYVSVNAGAGPRDSLMLAISRLGRVSVRVARTLIEVLVVVTAVLLGGPVGWGTLIFAVLIGPAVQFSFRLLQVRPLQPLPPLAGADEP